MFYDWLMKGLIVVTFAVAAASGQKAHAQDVLVIDICGGWQADGSFNNCDTVNPNNPDSAAGPNKLGGSVDAIRITNDTIKEMINVNPKVQRITPAGWTVPAGGSTEPTAPSTATATTTYTISLGGVRSASSPAQVCTDTATAFNGSSNHTCSGVFGPDVYSYGSSTSSSCVVEQYNHCGTLLTTITTGISTTNSCPAGYTFSSGTCNKTDETAVRKPTDSKVQVQRSSNTFSDDARDTEAGSGTVATATGCVVSSTNVSCGKNGKTVSVTLAGDGSTTITTTTPTSTGKSIVDTTILGAPDGTTGRSTVTGKSQTTLTGSGTSTGSSTTPDGCGAPGQAPCKVDETGTSTAGDVGLGKGATLVTSLTTLTSSATTAQSTGDMSAFGLAKYVAPTSDTSAPSFGLNGSDSCTPWTVTLIGNEFTVNPCPVANAMKTIIAFLLAGYTAIYAWHAFQPRKEA